MTAHDLHVRFVWDTGSTCSSQIKVDISVTSLEGRVWDNIVLRHMLPGFPAMPLAKVS